jgi:hypothetical protein
MGADSLPPFAQAFYANLAIVTLDFEFGKPGCGSTGSGFLSYVLVNSILLLASLAPTVVIMPIMMLANRVLMTGSPTKGEGDGDAANVCVREESAAGEYTVTYSAQRVGLRIADTVGEAGEPLVTVHAISGAASVYAGVRVGDVLLRIDSTMGGGLPDRMNDPAVRKVLDRLAEEMSSKHITMRAMLRELDRNNDRKLSRDELSHGLAEMCVTLKATELDTVMHAFDKDHDGKIDYGEFYSVLTTHAAGKPVSAPMVHWEVSQPHEQCSERIRTSARPIAIRFRRGPTRRERALFTRVWQWLAFGAAERFIWWRDRYDRRNVGAAACCWCARVRARVCVGECI